MSRVESTRRSLILGAFLAVAAVGNCGADNFIRGDGNADGVVDLADVAVAVSYLVGVHDTTCLDALDSNDDGRVDVGDICYTLGYIYISGPEPAPPFPRRNFRTCQRTSPWLKFGALIKTRNHSKGGNSHGQSI